MTEDFFEEIVVGAPPHGWSLGYVTVTTLRDHKKPIEAWRRGAFAVHEVHSENGSGRLTHAPTGLEIWTLYTTDQAAEFAERIENLTAWDEITGQRPLGDDIYPKIREIAEQIKTERDTP